MSQFNPEMLSIARGARGLSQLAFARSMRWSQGKASKVENGLIAVTEEEIRRMANVLGYSQELFSQQEPPAGFGSCCTYHRKRKTAPIKCLNELHDQINIRRIQVARLLRSGKFTKPIFPPMDIDEFESPQIVAQLLRSTWQLPRGPIRNLVNVIETAGGIVIQCDFPTAKIDAVSQRTRRLPPFFFLNRDKPVDRWRMSLAHELGHIIMHSAAPTPNAEEEANDFAAEFLMPEREIKSELRELTIVGAAKLKLKWRVSMQALIYRAHRLGAISDGRYKSLFVRLSQLGYRKHEPNELEQEQPKRLRKLIDRHLSEFKYTHQELAKAMLCTKEQLRSEYLGDGTQRFGVIS